MKNYNHRDMTILEDERNEPDFWSQWLLAKVATRRGKEETTELKDLYRKWESILIKRSQDVS